MPKRWKMGLVALACASLGAAGGIASGSAAKKSSATASSRPAPPGFRPGPPGAHRFGMRVHSEEVVLDRAGKAFITETEDNGTVQSVSGDEITIKEGTASLTYKTITVTIPAGATVYRNGAAAKVSDLKAGDHVHVSKSSDGTEVFAGDAAHAPGPGHGRFGGHGPRGDGDGPPPPPA